MKPTDEEQTKLRPVTPDATLQRSGTELRTPPHSAPEPTIARDTQDGGDTAARTLQAGRPVHFRKYAPVVDASK